MQSCALNSACCYNNNNNNNSNMKHMSGCQPAADDTSADLEQLRGEVRHSATAAPVDDVVIVTQQLCQAKVRQLLAASSQQEKK
jgi:hypothetical protein